MGKQFFGTSINLSATVSGVAASEITDVRGKAIKFDAEGKLVVASTAGENILGIALLTSGDPEGKVLASESFEVQVKDIGIALAGEAIEAGAPLTVNASGKLIKAATNGQFVVGYALNSIDGEGYVHVQIAKSYFATAT